VGGYSDWLRQGNALTQVDDPTNRKPGTSRVEAVREGAAGENKKLTFKLKHELEQLPGRIDTLERQLSELVDQTSEPQFYERPFEHTQPIMDQLTACQAELDLAVERWGELESLQ